MKKRLLHLMMVAAATPAFAQSVTVDGIEYRCDAATGTASVVRGISSDADVTIQESVTLDDASFKVTVIKALAFENNGSLTSVTIPPSVTTIEGYAFLGCYGLNAVHISNLEAWCNVDFRSNPLEYANNLYLDDKLVKNLVIPEGVQRINGCAFQDCMSLESLTLPASVTVIGRDAFAGCYNLKNVYIPDIAVWCNIDFCENTSLAGHAFNLCLGDEPVTELVIPEGVTQIKRGAFNYFSSLTSVSFPGSVTEIGAYAFSGCTGLTSVELPDAVTAIGDNAFYGCTGLTSVKIPDSATAVGGSAFYGCTGLTSVEISPSLTVMGDNAFYGCGILEQVKISDVGAWCGIDFGKDANPLLFAHNLYLGDELLTDMVIPEGTPEVKPYAFVNCDKLTSVSIPASLSAIGENAFKNCKGIKEVHISDVASWCNITYPSKSYGDNEACPLFYARNLYLGDNLITDLVIPEGVAEIKNNAFYYCTNLTSVKLPDSLTTIGGDAFYSCINLESVTFGKSISTIIGAPFTDCNGLKEVHISDLKGWCEIDFESNISTPLFYAHNLYLGDEPLTDLTIPEGIDKVKNNTFAGCAGFTSITIPDFVTEIGKSSFSGCESLTSLKLSESLTKIGEFAFSDCGSLTSLVIPDAVTELGEWVFSGCKSLESLTLGESLTAISEYAFRDCGLTSLTIPDTVTEIGEGAFSGCNDMVSLTLAQSVSTIGKNAFEYNHNMTAIHCLMSIPPAIESGYNGSFDSYKATLYVPADRVTAYRNAEGWSQFENIVASPSTAVEKLDADEVLLPTDYYNLEGVKVATAAPGETPADLPAGTYITRRGARTAKVIIR